ASDGQLVMSVPKYRRIDRSASGLIQIPLLGRERVSLNAEGLNQTLAETLRRVGTVIADDVDAWPSPATKFVFKGKDLTSEASYDRAFAAATRDKLPEWRLVFRAEMIPGDDGARLTALATNESDPEEFGIAWHPPEIFNVHLRLEATAGALISEP